VILDVYSRYVVGWTVQRRESAQVAKELIGQVCDQQQIQPGQSTVHADRGAQIRLLTKKLSSKHHHPSRGARKADARNLARLRARELKLFRELN
jgi:transposase InsO family protein